MKTGRAAMWANLKACGVLLWALGLFAGCGKTGTSESGETHFVSCNTDADCTGVTDAHTCTGGFCRGTSNDGGSTPDKTPACDGGCGDAECAAPGTCTLEAACKVVDCGTALVDDNACVRPSCQSDDDCPDDERCAALWFSKHYQCAQSGASCDCTAGLGLFPVNICSPVALAGMRGQWQKLIVTEKVLVGSVGDFTVRAFFPDGSVTIESYSAETGETVSSAAQLSTEDLDELTRQINGTSLRLLLGPDPCAERLPNPGDGRLDWSMDLYLSDARTRETPALSKNVTFCSSITGVLELVDRY